MADKTIVSYWGEKKQSTQGAPHWNYVIVFIYYTYRIQLVQAT